MSSMRLFPCSLILCGILLSLPTRLVAEEVKEKPTRVNLFDLPSDSLVQRYLFNINPDSIRDVTQKLQDYGTRYCIAKNRFTIAEWIKSKFLSLGITDVVIDSFVCYDSAPDTTTVQYNVVATVEGTEYPDRIFIIGGHYDSYSSGDPLIIAPGANDNASGTAGVLEIARVLLKNGFRPKSTIKFITFAGEELMTDGSSGSYHYADSAKKSGMDIPLMINLDMIAYTADALSSSLIQLYFSPILNNWIHGTTQVVRRYSILTPLLYSTVHSSSDGLPFDKAGYPTLTFVENGYDYMSYYHTPQDIVSNCRMDYCAELLRTPCAVLLKAASAPSEVKSLNVVDMGNGNSVKATWLENTDSHLRGYNIYLGNNSLQYDTVFFTTDSSILLENLLEDTTYFVGVAAEDSLGNESFIAEQTIIPYVNPLPPSNVSTDPLWHKVKLTWSPNKENDLLGYNIYHSNNPSGPFPKLNTMIIRDSTYIDSTASPEVYSYYSVRAVDSTLLENLNDVIVRSRPVSLDQGVLIVDETKSGDGSPMNPTETQVDIFYQSLLTDFTFHEYDFESEGKIAIDDLGAYSTIIWHGIQYSDTMIVKKNIQALQSYLQFGGNLLLTCLLPTRGFANNYSVYQDYTPGEFIYDFLKIAHSENKVFSRFIGASPFTSGYSSITVDTTKTQASTNYHLLNIEGIHAAPGATNIYRYETRYDTTVMAGKMKGQPVGIEYLGSDFKTVVISYPLYFMDSVAAKGFVEYVLIDRFAEITDVKSAKNPLPENFTLHQNYPNPFNSSTIIRYELPERSNVTLIIYDLLGRRVAEFINGQQLAGVYEKQWNANVSTGVYLCKLVATSLDRSARQFVQVRKMLLLK